MAKAKERRCGTCGYAKWRTNKAGQRLKKNYAGRCLCPLPPLPECVEGPFRVKVQKSAIVDIGGKECLKWCDEGRGTPPDAVDDGPPL